MPAPRNPTDPSDEPPNELSPANSTTSNESFYSLSPEMMHANGERGVGKPWSRVDATLQKDFAREKKAGKLSFERKVEMYGEKLEEKFKELEERLLTREEELLLKGRELQRLKAENYLLNCRVETISSPSKSAPRIFQTSPEHPNARIIISDPFGNTSPKNRNASAPRGDIFDPQPPSKARKALAMAASAASDDNTRRSSRKRTVKTYDDSSSDTDSDDMVETKRRKVAAGKRRVSEPVKDAASATSPGEPRRRKSSTKLLESAESTPKTKKEKKEDWKPSSSGKNANREKEARLDRKENEVLYETLQKQVTIDLLKRRGIPTTEQEEMVMDICKTLELDQNTDLATRAVTSVRYWVAHKSWRLRDHFKYLGQRYKAQQKAQHRNEDWSNALPPVSVVKPLTNQKEVERWLFQSLGMRLAQRRMMSNPDIRRALWTVFVGGLRYGIRAAYDNRITSPFFQTAIESLDVFTKDYEYPVNETTGFRGKMKVIKDESEVEEDVDPGDELPDWEFDWNAAEEALKPVQEG